MKAAPAKPKNLVLPPNPPPDPVSPPESPTANEAYAYIHSIVNEVVLATIRQLVRKEKQDTLCEMVAECTIGKIRHIDEYISAFGNNERLSTKPELSLEAAHEAEPVR